MRVTGTADTSMVEGYHTVPLAEATANARMRDVIGNKEDTAQQTGGTNHSLMKYVKGLLVLHVPPSADVTSNANVRSVVGSKLDTVDTAVGTQSSLMRYVKGLLHLTLVPTADTVDNGRTQEVIGQKTDTEQTVVGDTSSLMRYLKGLIQLVAQRSVGKVARTENDTASLVDVVNITDKGVLTGIDAQALGTDNGYLKVTIDGTVIMAEADRCVWDGNKMFSLAFNHRFNTSLRVESKNAAGAVVILTHVAYTTD